MITCDEKFSSVRAAVRVDLTAERYGLSVFDYRPDQGSFSSHQLYKRIIDLPLSLEALRRNLETAESESMCKYIITNSERARLFQETRPRQNF
jgi:hypothetical protein